MSDFSDLKPCFKSNGSIIIHENGPVNRFCDVISLLSSVGIEFFNADGTFFLLRNKHGDIISPPLLKRDIDMFLSGFMVGIAQPLKYREAIRAYLVEDDD